MIRRVTRKARSIGFWPLARVGVAALGLYGVAAAGLWLLRPWLPSAAPAMASTDGLPAGAPEASIDLGKLPGNPPDQHVYKVLGLLEQARIGEAISATQALIAQHPNYQLAHLLHAELLRMQAFSPALIASIGTLPTQELQDRLSDLKAEAQRRIAATQAPPPIDARPDELIALAPDEPWVIVVDAERSRLYLLRNISEGKTLRTEIVDDFYVSLGKHGIGKLVEGDKRTPLGVYHITSRKTSADLPPFYGFGALTLNYPNPVDRIEGRTGFGIWIHGTPPEQFVRAPFASDGCVVSSNVDMERLYHLVGEARVPVLVLERVNWQTAGQAAPVDNYRAVLQGWQQQRAAEDLAGLRGLISERYWQRGSQPIDMALRLAVRTGAKLDVGSLTVLRPGGDGRYFFAQFEELENGKPTGLIRAQYWMREGDTWKLAHDRIVQGTPNPELARLGRGSRPVAAAPEAVPDDGDQAAVQSVVAGWADAWSRRDVSRYLEFYGPDFVPSSGASRAQWENERRARILGKQRIEVTLSELQIQVRGNEATARFRQRYVADTLNTESRKRLELQRNGNRWLIVRESSG